MLLFFKKTIKRC